MLQVDTLELRIIHAIFARIDFKSCIPVLAVAISKGKHAHLHFVLSVTSPLLLTAGAVNGAVFPVVSTQNFALPHTVAASVVEHASPSLRQAPLHMDAFVRNGNGSLRMPSPDSGIAVNLQRTHFQNTTDKCRLCPRRTR